MTVTDLAEFVEKYLRSCHPEWFDHPQTHEAHFEGFRILGGVWAWDVTDQSAVVANLHFFLKALERHNDLRMRYIRWQDGSLTISFSAEAKDQPIFENSS